MPTPPLTNSNDYWSTTAAGAFRIFAGAGNDTVSIRTSKSRLSSDSGDTLVGGDGNDLLSGGYTNDRLIGDGPNDDPAPGDINSAVGSGNDTLSGGYGDDTLEGGAGNDLLDGSWDNDFLDGGAGDDTLLNGYGNDEAHGGAGNDLITTSSGNDVVYAGSDDDTIIASNGNDQLYGESGNDSITAGGGDDTIHGGDGTDAILAGGGNDVLDGGAGDDNLDGGDGADTASYLSAGSGVHVGLALTTAQDTGGAGVDTLSSIEVLEGSTYADTLQGDAGNNILKGNAGNDILDGRDGADQLDGGSGTDTVDYTGSAAAVHIDLTDSNPESGGYAEGDILLFNSGGSLVRTIEAIWGSSFDDTLVADDRGAMQLEGRDGDDTVIGGAGGDALLGGTGSDELTGNSGNDQIDGGEGSDRITGDAGNDTLWGGNGADQLDGGSGSDYAYYNDSTGAVSINLADGSPESGGFADGDTLTNIENIFGSSFNDTLIGDDGANVIYGNSGNDVIAGGKGYDILVATTGTGQTTAVDTFDYNALNELTLFNGSNYGAWDTIYGFTGSGSVSGRDFVDLHDVFTDLGLSFSSGSAAYSGGYWGIKSISIGGTASTFIYVDADGGASGGTFGDGDDYLVAGFLGNTGWSTSSVLA